MILRINNLWSITAVICLMPLVGLAFDMALNNLGGNPIQAVHIRLGDWSLRFLWLTLAITPIQTITRWRGMTCYRQLFGLYTFFYASLHLLVYLILDNDLVWFIIATDIKQSPYIWFGVIAYTIVLALAITSPNSMKKRMGRHWKKLHRFIYIAALAAMIHYFWQLKANLAEPLFYLITVILLLLFRALNWLKNRQFAKLMLPKARELP